MGPTLAEMHSDLAHGPNRIIARADEFNLGLRLDLIDQFGHDLGQERSEH